MPQDRSTVTSSLSSTSASNVTDGGSSTVTALPTETPKISTLDGSIAVSTPSTSEAGTSTTTAAEDIETDSPLDTAHFLSFDEWKKQNLAKVGQSPENLAGRVQSIDPNRRRPVINNALDTLGEESEIELDFSGFGSGHTQKQDSVGSSNHASREDAPAVPTSQAQPALRSKDAGTTCKERTNYASFDCAATMLKNNPEAKSGSSVLVENKDSYLLNKCAAKNKFIIVELCNDILIDTVVLANYEFFSSIFRHFRISVSDKYPVKIDKWKDLGTFEARNTREVQAFLIENPLIWARYLRIEFLTHYGSEYYCPVSLLRVHGTTMMDEFRHQEELARGEPQDDDEILEPEVTPQVSVAQEALVASVQGDVATAQVIPTVDPNTKPASDVVVASSSPVISSPVTTAAAQARTTASSTVSMDVPVDDPLLDDAATCAPRSTPTRNMAQSDSTAEAEVETASPTSENIPVSVSAPNVTAPSLPQDIASSFSTTSIELMPTTPLTSIDSATTSVASANASTIGDSVPSSYSSLDAVNVRLSSTAAPQNSTTPAPSPKPANVTTNATRASVPVSSSAPAQPATQESFFKSVSKRLAQLEANSTLSLQYIEAQSLILRDAFSKVEKRQISTTTTFLKHVNDTIMTELHGFRQAYDQLWQSTVLELDAQREQSQRETLALSSRLTLVADELVWQKRMGIVQSTLLLMCLALILFNRGAMGTSGPYSALEIPLLQHMLLKTRSGMESDPESPADAKSRSPINLFRRKVLRRSAGDIMGNGDVTDDSRPVSSAGPAPAARVEIDTPPDEVMIGHEGVNGHVDDADAYIGPECAENMTRLDSPQQRSLASLVTSERLTP
ncbi:hypothetical protein B0A48_09559 [Cryoendolithus antarcticus]|uniref:SUN domain-containing protein n=1 Tax=Cryoendolithus antarcticus TaxID=1507870 RepID=A0A1V8SZP6_9PEZI|nr:hypothetical protein B0A48_09559 [Cryoendolithus antarcticus]